VGNSVRLLAWEELSINPPLLFSMDQSSRDQKARQIWIKTYQQLGSVSKAARRCGIPRSTLYRWLKRFKEHPDDNLSNRSRKPHKLAKQVVNEELEKLVLQIREGFKFGKDVSECICYATIKSTF
jgi:transposase